MDFFTTEVLTLKGLTTYYVLFMDIAQGHVFQQDLSLSGLCQRASRGIKRAPFWGIHPFNFFSRSAPFP